VSKLKKYKMKTHSGAKRRFYVTGTGRLLRRKSHVNNARRKKRGATLRLFTDKLPVSPDRHRSLRGLLPYLR